MSEVAIQAEALRPTSARGSSTAWWGMAALIGTESMAFAVLLAAYFFLQASVPRWPPAGIELPNLELGIPFSLLLWASSLPIVWAERSIRHDRQRGLRAGLALAAVMGIAFLLYTAKDFSDLHFDWRSTAYGSAFYTIVGLHALHVLVGVLMNVVVSVKAWQGKFSSRRHQSVAVFALYWHFVDAVWVAVFGFLFVGVRL